MTQLKKKLEPYVSIESMVNYDPARPETRTASPLVDAVLDAIRVVKNVSTRSLGEYLGIEERKLSAGLEIATGYTLVKLRELWTPLKIKQLRRENPRMTEEEMLRIVGFTTKSALWNQQHRGYRKKYYSDEKNRFEHRLNLTHEQFLAELEKRSNRRMEEIEEHSNRRMEEITKLLDEEKNRNQKER